MTMKRRGQAATIVLLAANLALGYALHSGVVSDLVMPELGGGDAIDRWAPLARSPLGPTALAPADAFAEIAARPVFNPTRRPVDEAKPPPPQAQPQAPPQPPAPVVLPPFTLVAVVVAAGQRSAVLKTPAANDVLRLVEGQQLQGWTVSRILADRVVFRAGAVEKEVGFPRFEPQPANGLAARP